MKKFFEIVVTPDVAQKYLSKDYEHNRHISNKIVEDYARMMRIGKWNEEAPNTIVITNDGVLLDGQHRLMAVVKSGVPIKMTFTVCDSESAFEYIDIGKTRSASDFLDVKNRNETASVARVACCLNNGVQGL